ncbi:MAG: ribosome maturation factor RimM [Candidatus Rokuibacteriota bacterium]
MTEDTERLVAIGEIVRPHGLRGELRVTPLTDDPARFERVTACVLWDPSRDARRPARVLAARRQGGNVLLALEGCASVDAAARLVGQLVAVPESEALPPGPGRFYPWQLAGCRVVTEDGQPVGTVTRVETGPAHDLWVVTDGVREHLIPAVAEIVVDLDLGQRRVVIRPPDGLLDL